ncbi:MAG: dihydroorotate dehydrogenase [bacterium]|nr:dihydroorotate dehydrogenase [bacterium]
MSRIRAGQPDLSVEVGSLQLTNPLCSASGCFGYGLDCDPLLPPEVFGGVVTKTVTPQPRKGNPVPRLRETSSGLLNSIGLENCGLSPFILEKIPALAARGIKPIVSISAGDPQGFADMASALNREPVAALELNLSCPNVASAGANFATDPGAVVEIVAAVKGAFTAGPVWVKLTPNVTDITAIAAAAAAGGADAVCAINTLLGMDIDLTTGRSPFARTTAGLSGPAIMPVALAAVYRISRSVEIPVVGIGGIASAEDVLKFLAAGASAVQVGTIVFRDPTLPARILDELAAWLTERGCDSISELETAWR